MLYLNMVAMNLVKNQCIIGSCKKKLYDFKYAGFLKLFLLHLFLMCYSSYNVIMQSVIEYHEKRYMNKMYNY